MLTFAEKLNAESGEGGSCHWTDGNISRGEACSNPTTGKLSGSACSQGYIIPASTGLVPIVILRLIGGKKFITKLERY